MKKSEPSTSPGPTRPNSRETRISKRYGSRSVVDGVTFECLTGTVTGLLGPNGAGKSTTLKMLLDLVAPTRGSATVNGIRYKDLPHPGRTVGVSLDASGLHPGRTIQETLRLTAKIIGVPRGRADEVMEEVRLGSDGKKLVSKCSLGMRQRLSIGIAILGDPEYLVLDEPVNGLDPGGIAWMRELLRRKAAAGHTVLLSSHLLREVESVADRVVIMGSGRVIVQGTLSELIVGETGVLVAASDQEALRRALTREDIAHEKACRCGLPRGRGVRARGCSPVRAADASARPCFGTPPTGTRSSRDSGTSTCAGTTCGTPA